MADTTAQRTVANWLCNEILPREFGQGFRRQTVPLVSGGGHSFAAVSDDGSIVATVVTSRSNTTAGKLGVGKLSKVRADLFFLLLAKPERKLVIATDLSMYRQLCRERDEHGRWPAEVELRHCPVPDGLAADLAASQRTASVEVGG